MDELFNLGMIAGALALLAMLEGQIRYLEGQVMELRGRAAGPREFLPPFVGYAIVALAFIAMAAFLVATARNIYAMLSS